MSRPSQWHLDIKEANCILWQNGDILVSFTPGIHWNGKDVEDQWRNIVSDYTFWHNRVRIAGNRAGPACYTGAINICNSWNKFEKRHFLKFFSARLFMIQSVCGFSDMRWLNAINLRWSESEDRRRTQTSVDCIRAISDGNTCFISLNWHANPLPLAIYKCHFM